jgi:putative ABC transport system permease protein
MPESIKMIESKWKELVPDLQLVYFFADEAYNNQYRDEQRFGKLFICFATLAILISCLGLLGLSAFSITQRTREVGVRKVMGASVGGIVKLLSVDFIKLVFVSTLIAIPVAWFGMDRWLRDFAYRIDMPWWAFMAAGFIAVVIAVATVSFQAIKAALMNPVKSLSS